MVGAAVPQVTPPGQLAEQRLSRPRPPAATCAHSASLAAPSSDTFHGRGVEGLVPRRTHAQGRRRHIDAEA